MSARDLTAIHPQQRVEPPARSEQWLRAARQARLLSWFSLAWMGAEGGIAIAAGRGSDRLRLSHACGDHGHVGGDLPHTSQYGFQNTYLFRVFKPKLDARFGEDVSRQILRDNVVMAYRRGDNVT